MRTKLYTLRLHIEVFSDMRAEPEESYLDFRIEAASHDDAVLQLAEKFEGVINSQDNIPTRTYAIPELTKRKT